MRLTAALGTDGDFDPRGVSWAAGRSLLAAAQLAVLVATPDSVLFYHLRGEQQARCGGLARISVWCVSGAAPRGDSPATVFAVLVLLGVVAGCRPRWLCVPHWYVAFSINADVAGADGSDRVAAVVTLLLIPACLGDTRVNHWRRPDRTLTPGFSGASQAAVLLVRIQLAVVYALAASSKLEYHAWRNGTALWHVSNDPQFGFPALLRPVTGALLPGPHLGRALTWSVLVVEFAIAVAMLTPARVRRFALPLAVLLHGAIALVMGLVAFAAIMIASVVLATSSADGRLRWRVRPAWPRALALTPRRPPRLRVGSAVNGEYGE